MSWAREGLTDDAFEEHYGNRIVSIADELKTMINSRIDFRNSLFLSCVYTRALLIGRHIPLVLMEIIGCTAMALCPDAHDPWRMGLLRCVGSKSSDSMSILW